MINSMYERYALQYDKAIQENIYNANFERPSMIALLPELEGKSVLDLGCGSGVYAEYFVSKGAKVTAIDNSINMINITREKLADQLICYQQDLAKGLPSEKDASFDVVVCPLVIHYIEDILPLFTDIHRVMKPSSVFVFSTHHPLVDFKASVSGDYFKLEKIIEHWNTIGKPVEVNYFRRPLEMLFSALAKAGLCVLEFTEGKPSDKMAKISMKYFKKLSTKPTFIFFKCAKLK